MSPVTFMELLSLACFQDVLILCIFHLPLGGKVSIHRKMPKHSASVLWVSVISLTTPLQKWFFWLQHLADISCLACRLVFNKEDSTCVCIFSNKKYQD